MAKTCASGLPEGAQHAVCRCYGAVAAGGLWLLLGGAAAAIHAAGVSLSCGAATGRSALCAAGTSPVFAADGDFHAGVCAACAVLLRWIRKLC